jgi:hypothetical protein
MAKAYRYDTRENVMKIKTVDPSDISVTRLHDGSYELATIYDGRRVHQRYFGYALEECVTMFQEYLKTL